MIDRVIGKNDNFQIIFEFVEETGVWRAQLPSNLSGEYYIDLYAYDKAGNVGFMSKALFVVDTSNLCVHLIHTDYYVSVGFMSDFDIEIECNNHQVSLIIENQFRNKLRFRNDYVCRLKEVLKCNAA